MLARSRALTACAAATVAAAIAGCTTTTTTPSVPAGRSPIYMSVPPASASPAAQDVLSAEQLAFQQAQGGDKVGKFTIKLVPFSGNEAVRQRAHGDRGHDHDRVPGRDRPRRLRGLDRDHQRPGHAPGQPDRHGASS